MSSIPEEIIHDILSRLPVKFLLACKCVSKNWSSLISSTGFVRMHHNRTIQRNNPTTLLLTGCDSWSCKNLFSIGYDSCELLLSKLLLTETDRCVTYAMDREIHYPFKSLDYPVQLMGCCHGLICLCIVNRRFFCLWNPATREYKETPKSNVELGMVGFGYDYKSNDYKLLAAGGVSFRNSIEVFSLKSNSWRTIGNVPDDWLIRKRSGVLVNGELHWLVDRKYSSDVILVCLDISNEIFKEMELPKEPLDEIEQRRKTNWDSGLLKFSNLGVVEGCLCLLVADVEACVQVWVMQNYGVRESWIKRYTVHDEKITHYRSFRLMWSFKSGEILFRSAYTGLLLYIPIDDKVIKPNIYSLTKLRQEERYFESLVSLNSGTYVGEEKQIKDSMAVSHISSASVGNLGETLILRGTLVGHNDMVTAIACPTDNSNMIVSSSCDKSILVWTLSKQEGSYGVPKLRLTGHNHSVQDVALSSDAQFALSGSSDGELRLWDLNTGVTTRRFIGHTKDVLSVAYSADNSLIVSASRDCSIKVWNTRGECMHTFQDGDSHTNWVSCVRFIPEKYYATIVSASWDKTVKVWDLAKCKLRHTFAGHGGYVNTVTVSPDGSLCASGGEDGFTLLWDLANGKNCGSIDFGGIIHGLCFSPNRYWLCAATEDGVKIWDLESRCCVQNLKIELELGKNERSYCSSINWSSDGSTLFTGYTDGTIRVWSY